MLNIAVSLTIFASSPVLPYGRTSVAAQHFDILSLFIVFHGVWDYSLFIRYIAMSLTALCQCLLCTIFALLSVQFCHTGGQLSILTSCRSRFPVISAVNDGERHKQWCFKTLHCSLSSYVQQYSLSESVFIIAVSLTALCENLVFTILAMLSVQFCHIGEHPWQLSILTFGLTKYLVVCVFDEQLQRLAT